MYINNYVNPADLVHLLWLEVIIEFRPLYSENHSTELGGACKAIVSKPLLNAGIQIKADLTDRCLIFS